MASLPLAGTINEVGEPAPAFTTDSSVQNSSFLFEVSLNDRTLLNDTISHDGRPMVSGPQPSPPREWLRRRLSFSESNSVVSTGSMEALVQEAFGTAGTSIRVAKICKHSRDGMLNKLAVKALALQAALAQLRVLIAADSIPKHYKAQARGICEPRLLENLAVARVHFNLLMRF